MLKVVVSYARATPGLPFLGRWRRSATRKKGVHKMRQIHTNPDAGHTALDAESL